MILIRELMVAVLSVGVLCAAEKLPQTPEALLVDYQKAIDAGNEAAVLALWELDLTNPEIVKTLGEYAKDQIKTLKGGTFSLQAVEANDAFPLVMEGTKVEYLAEPQGMIYVKTEFMAGFPYARLKAGYKLIGPRWTKLNWQGPPDKGFSFMVYSQSPAKPEGPLTLKIRYNTSGIILEKNCFLKKPVKAYRVVFWPSE